MNAEERIAQLEAEVAQLKARPNVCHRGKVYGFDDRADVRHKLLQHRISAESEAEARRQLEAKIGKEAADRCKFKGYCE